MVQAVEPACVADVLEQASSALGFLAEADWASLPGQVRVERTFGGAGRLSGDLSPEVAEKLQKICDALGKRLGPEDLRSEGERCHDAIGEALSRLLKANLVPQSSVKPFSQGYVLTCGNVRDAARVPSARA